jgi:hypothetical protein
MIEIQTMLLLVKSPQDNDLQITFDVAATAKVREYVGGDSEPGEFLIEDIEIVAVRCWSIRYGNLGTSWPIETDLKASWARLEWLNATLDERDDWTEAIRIAATHEHVRQRDQIRN